MESGKEVVVVTGGSGFLGQHVVKHLQSDSRVGEVRVLDVLPYVDRLTGSAPSVPVHWVCANLVDDEAKCAQAFLGADLVVHCAALVDRSHPADLQALHKNNVKATEVVVSLCQRMSVPRLVFTSTVEVVLVPYLRSLGSFSLIVNQTEARALPPNNPEELDPYPASKLRAERIVLQADGSKLHNGGVLRTVALRPPLMYGEEDRRLVPGLLQLAKLCDNTLLQLGGANNRQQHAYVGNVAWAHVCAGRSLSASGSASDSASLSASDSAQSVGGLPVFVTDDSPRGDVLRLTQLLLTFPDACGAGAAPLVRVRATPLPAWMCYLGAAVVETLITTFLATRLPVRPSAFVSYLSSFVSLSRLRAETRLGFSPKYTSEESIARSRAYYARTKHMAAVTQ